MFNKILCALDGSAHAGKALELAIDMAKKYEAGLVIAHVLLRNSDTTALERFARTEGLVGQVEPEIRRLQGMETQLEVGPGYDDRAISSRVLVEVGQHLLDDARDRAREHGLRDVAVVLMDGDAADRILRCVDEHGADCVVMGSRGLSDVKGMFLGSVSHKVANRAACTCIAVK